MRHPYLQPINLVGSAFLALLLVTPLRLGSGLSYGLMGAITLLAITGCICSDRTSQRQGLRDLVHKAAHHPHRWPLLALFICALLSLWMSLNFWYSLRVMRTEIVLNLLLYLSLSIFAWSYGTRIDWLQYIRRGNVVFLALYLGLLLQWLLFPQSPLFIQPEYSLDGRSVQDIVFFYGQMNNLFNGIKHISVYLLLFLTLTFLDVIGGRERKKNLLLFSVNLALLILTTKRAPVLGLIVGLSLTPLLYASARKYLLVGLGLIGALLILIFSTDLRSYIIRGEGQFFAGGNILTADKNPNSSVSLRIHTYKNFLAEVGKHPFRGIGMGRRNLKRFMPDVVSKAGLPHGHNTFLNYALYMGVQGALALFLLISFQVMVLWRAWAATTDAASAEIIALGLVFLTMFWIANTFEDHFRHDPATLYWLFMAVPTGIAQMVREQVKNPALSSTGRV